MVRPFLYSTSVYSYYLFLISSVSVRSLLFLSFIVPILDWNVPLISPVFLKRSLVFKFCCFPLFLCLVLAILWSSAFSLVYLSFLPFFSLLFPWLFVKPPQTTPLPCCVSFSLGWFWSLPPVQCYEPPSIVLQALYLQIWSLESICHLHCITIRDLI